MKKFIYLYMALCISMFSFGSIWITQANLDAWITTRSASILGDINFWYLDSNISVASINATSIIFESPVILDEDQDDVLNYILRYGPSPFSNIADGLANVSIADFADKEFDFVQHTSDTFEMMLTVQDGIDPTQLYYVVALPIDKNGEPGEMSWPDICFRLATNEYGVGLECSTLASNMLHSSAGANMQLSNISNTCNNNQITLTWTAVSGAPRVRIYRVVNGQQSTLIAEKNMSDQQHSYPLPNPTPQEVVRFVPIDASGNPTGTQKDYTLKLCQPTPPTTPPTTPPPAPQPPSIPSVPKVWPEQNLMYIIGATFLLYIITRARKWKKNKTS